MSATVHANVDLSDADFSGGDLRDAVFSDCILCGANFSRCDVREATFERCDMRGSTFRGAKGPMWLLSCVLDSKDCVSGISYYARTEFPNRFDGEPRAPQPATTQSEFVSAHCDACREDMPDVSERHQPILCRSCVERWETRVKFERQHGVGAFSAREKAGLSNPR